jgi:hypothetical protein
VRKAARERLLAMVDPALDALLRILRVAPPCEHCGRSDADRDPVVLRAAQLVLDRTGFHPSVDVQVQRELQAPAYLQWIPSERLEQMAAWHAEAKAAMERGDPTAAVTESLEESAAREQQWLAEGNARSTTDSIDAVLIESDEQPATEPDIRPDRPGGVTL